MDSSLHVIGCYLIQHTRVQYAFDDVVITMYESLETGEAWNQSVSLSTCYPGATEPALVGPS